MTVKYKMPPVSGAYSDLAKVLRGLSLAVLCDVTKQLISFVTWKAIKKQIHAKQHPMNAPNVINAILFLMKTKTNVSDQEIQVLVANIELYRVANEISHSKVWYTYVLKGQNVDTSINEKQLARILQKELKMHETNKYSYNVTCCCRRELLWIQIVRTRDHLKKVQRKFYFAIQPLGCHIFSSHRMLPKIYLEVFKTVFNGAHFKLIELSGKKISSLIEIISNTENRTPSNNVQVNDLMSEELRFNPHYYRETAAGRNYSQVLKRIEFSDSLLGSDPPSLEKVTLIINNVSLTSDPTQEQQNFNARFTIKSSNVSNCLKSLMQQNILEIPPPLWVEEFVNKGRNVIVLEDESS